ncbi:IMP dehydrogenase [Nanoarchaeota archaeon]
MVTVNNDPAHTFSEYRFIPGLTKKEHTIDNIDLKTPVVKHDIKKGEESLLYLNNPFASAIMQSLGCVKFAHACSLNGLLPTLHCSQPEDNEAEMAYQSKRIKQGFVDATNVLSSEATLKDIIEVTKNTGYSTIPITVDGKKNGKLVGIVTDSDYWNDDPDLNKKVEDFMTPFEMVFEDDYTIMAKPRKNTKVEKIKERKERAKDLFRSMGYDISFEYKKDHVHVIKKMIHGKEGVTLSKANEIMRKSGRGRLPIIDNEGNLKALVFQRDHYLHQDNPDELTDDNRQPVVFAGLNTHDYKTRAAKVVEAGADGVAFTSMNGHTEYMAEAICWMKKNFPGIPVGAGNVIDDEGFLFLADAEADFIGVGIGGGSICITQEQLGIGMGQASSVYDVAMARNKYAEKTGVYIPIYSDGGIVQDYHIALALALGADFVMMGRYFAGMLESASPRRFIDGRWVKEYWGEGNDRARNWQRYYQEEGHNLFEQGVDGYVPYLGPMKGIVKQSLAKIKEIFVHSGCMNMMKFHDNAKMRLASELSIKEGDAHDMILPQRPTVNPVIYKLTDDGLIEKTA